MAAKKYAQYVKTLSFKDGPGYYRQVTSVNGKEFGLDFNIEYGAYHAAGAMGAGLAGAHKHDYNQALFWLGGDTNDMGELGAEVELCIGEEAEKHMVTSTTAVSVPAGLPHFPAGIVKMDRRFIYMEVSCAHTLKEKPVAMDKTAFDKPPVMSFVSKQRERVMNVAFSRKGAWSYGPKNRDDAGGSLAFIRGRDPGFEFLIMCESLKKAPYRFGPDPDKPHAHPLPEILNFIGTDLNDLSALGGEVEIYLGKELERHVITKPTSVVIPGKLAHCPLVVTKVDRPFILMDVRPFGSEPVRPGRL
jgi:uncharacterized RmlC-like cupin family protein